MHFSFGVALRTRRDLGRSSGRKAGASGLRAVPPVLIAAVVLAAFPRLADPEPPGERRAAGFRPSVHAPKQDLLVGIKIYERAGEMPRVFAEFEDLGFNTLFVSEALASDPEFRGLAREKKMAVFVIQPVFYDPEELKKDPDLHAVTDAGAPAREDWVAFACPSRDEYRRRRVESIASAVARLEPEGVSLDFIRFFAYWEMIRPDRSSASIPNTCFCTRCLERFSRETGVRLPAASRTPQAAARWIEARHLEKWTDWKCRVISSMVEDLVRRTRQVRPGLRVNLHAVPWRADDFGGAIRRIVAQDFAVLSKLTDYISPMCYSAMLHRSPAWIASVVKDLEARAACPILPSIQVKAHYPSDTPLDAAAFEACLRAALAPPSAGVVFWSWDLLEKAPEAKRVIKRCLRAERSGPDV